MSQTVDSLVATVTAATTVLDSAAVYIGGVPGLISDAVSKALANGATAAELAPLTDLAATMKTKSDAVLSAIAANTPSDPPTPPMFATAKGR